MPVLFGQNLTHTPFQNKVFPTCVTPGPYFWPHLTFSLQYKFKYGLKFWAIDLSNQNYASISAPEETDWLWTCQEDENSQHTP